jgi:curved DNA-binding protein CbpA
MDPHEVLGVDPDADEETVVAAYRRRVKEVHPDQGGSIAEFRAVKEASERLLADDHDVAATVAEGEDEAAPEDDDGADEAGEDETETEEDHVTVEYLDYEALVDHGWALDDPDLFERAAEAGLDADAYGTMAAAPDEFLLAEAEACGFTWPYSCRGGACANCAVAVLEGEMSMPVNHILTPEMVDRGIRLSCVSEPLTDELRVVYNVKHLPGLDELRLPPGPGSSASD